MSARATRRPAPAVERARKTAGRPVTADDRTPACPRAATSEHATLRRRQILDAAEDCFRRHGFHNTSMAEIAKSFGMSAGHIYNYFDSKEAIIAAIVERDLEDFMLRATALQAADDIRAAMLARVEASVADQLSTTRAARQFEVLAEAGRNPAVAAMVQAADDKVRTVIRDMLGRTRPDGHAGRDLDGKVTVLLALFEGLMVRGLRQSELQRAQVTRVLRGVISEMLR